MVSGKFVTAINCIDGRTQVPVSDCNKIILIKLFSGIKLKNP